jgi:hypothetical protein
MGRSATNSAAHRRAPQHAIIASIASSALAEFQH